MVIQAAYFQQVKLDLELLSMALMMVQRFYAITLTARVVLVAVYFLGAPYAVFNMYSLRQGNRSK